MEVSRERLPVGRESWEEVQDGSCLHETPRGWHLHSPTTLGKNRLLQAGSWFGSFLLPKEATDPSFKTTSLGMGWALGLEPMEEATCRVWSPDRLRAGLGP